MRFAILLALFQAAYAFRASLQRPAAIRLGSPRSLTQVRLSGGPQDEPQLAQVAAGGINTSGKPPFEIRGFSLATLFLGGGFLLTVGSFAEYFSEGGGSGVSGLGFVYGIPVLLIGLSLKYAEIPPVEVVTTPAADDAFEKKATETIKQIKQDVTRHRYGDDAHLDSTLKALGLQLPQKDFPELEYLKQDVAPNGELAFSMVFRSMETPYRMWAEPDRIKRYETFFGPGVNAEVEKISSEERLVAIKLTTGEKVTEAPAAEAPPAVDTPAEAA
uniref:Thylakoid membrane protein n=1 Tax=Pinguiococcus pyrenoidosus TaxID=172671 RepID=A0A7R9UF83_9STRA|mmetsp:Transcript_6025/g.23411  ORF Transcript_6025/g.23411 Transcript_6025/m.23411 type:complete len:273 (+) Transcript_6025:98-916(+)